MKYQKREAANSEDISNLAIKTEFVGEEDKYAVAVNRKIRERYSLSDELAIMRKALAKLGISDAQLDEYNAFVEQCKQEVKDEENESK